MAKKSADRPAEIFFAAHLIEEELEKVDSLRKLADKWQTKHPNLSRIINDLTSFGPDMEKLFAHLFTGGRRDEFSQRAREWRDKHPDWFPDAYLKKHGEHRPNRSFSWWEKEVEAYLETESGYEWAAYHASERVRGPEPKVESRKDYVRREIENIAASNDSEKRRLFREFRESRPRQPPSGKVSLKRSGSRPSA